MGGTDQSPLFGSCLKPLGQRLLVGLSLLVAALITTTLALLFAKVLLQAIGVGCLFLPADADPYSIGLVSQSWAWWYS